MNSTNFFNRKRVVVRSLRRGWACPPLQGQALGRLKNGCALLPFFPFRGSPLVLSVGTPRMLHCRKERTTTPLLKSIELHLLRNELNELF